VRVAKFIGRLSSIIVVASLYFCMRWVASHMLEPNEAKDLWIPGWTMGFIWTSTLALPLTGLCIIAGMMIFFVIGWLFGLGDKDSRP
jgi:hypothetical protein